MMQYRIVLISDVQIYCVYTVYIYRH